MYPIQDATLMVYPRVKVRIQEDDDDYKFSPRDQVYKSPHLEEKGKPLIAKVIVTTTRHVPNSTREPVSASTVNKKSNKLHSIWRPRAVLSSPANDGAIGKRNKLKSERFSAVRKCKSESKIMKNSEGQTPPMPLSTKKGINAKNCSDIFKLQMQ
ncbi:hypothetical protein M5689_019285 [Euphorbia peplus]|nr:hypothetical protein M5689_019285 [Euphorbia peplus]